MNQDKDSSETIDEIQPSPLSDMYDRVMMFSDKAMRYGSGFQMVEKDGKIRFIDMSEVYK